jgi:hypothetical protein
LMSEFYLSTKLEVNSSTRMEVIGGGRESQGCHFGQ